MPVGTQGTVKTLGSEDLEVLGFELILSNTYHLSLRPGSDLIQRMGGLHKFMSWKGAILTDSGGYQVMSLADLRKLDDEGVRFASHLDGNEVFLTPERAMEIQAEIGVDIRMVLDECPPYPCTREEAANAMKRTHKWAMRSIEALKAPSPFSRSEKGEGVGGEGSSPATFGIVQGGIHDDLRRESAAFISELPFDGLAIGGVSVGEPTELQYPVVALTAQ